MDFFFRTSKFQGIFTRFNFLSVQEFHRGIKIKIRLLCSMLTFRPQAFVKTTNLHKLQSHDFFHYENCQWRPNISPIVMQVTITILRDIEFSKRSRKCLSQSEARGGHLVFPIGPKNTNLVKDVEILLPLKFR